MGTSSTGCHRQGWLKPRARYIKLNVAETQSDAAGAILRNNSGEFVATACEFIPHVPNVAMAEAMAMRLGLKLANFSGCHAIIAESDSSEVINLCSGQERLWNEATAIYTDCVTTSALIGNVEFEHCPREANQAAHVIASHSFNSQLSCNWADDAPSFI